MVTRHSRHGHKAPRQACINMATDENVTDSLWEDFFSGLVNVLDICEYHSLNVNLDFPSAAILFNQLDITVSVLRSVSDGVANLQMKIYFMKEMLYAVRCLKSNEDMILALAGQFKQLSYEPEKFR